MTLFLVTPKPGVAATTIGTEYASVAEVLFTQADNDGVSLVVLRTYQMDTGYVRSELNDDDNVQSFKEFREVVR
jgi:uncharacterized protein (UPF0210 family)